MRYDFNRNDTFMGLSNNVGVFLAGVLVGALAGSAVMLFVAPQSGRELREQLRDRSLELRDRVMETAEDARLRAEEAAAQARDRAQQVTEGARARLQRR
jgi:gas vesicle protein